MKASMALELRANASELRSTPSGRTPKQNSLFLGRRTWGEIEIHEFEAKADEEEEAALLANVLSISPEVPIKDQNDIFILQAYL